MSKEKKQAELVANAAKKAERDRIRVEEWNPLYRELLDQLKDWPTLDKLMALWREHELGSLGDSVYRLDKARRLVQRWDNRDKPLESA